MKTNTPKELEKLKDQSFIIRFPLLQANINSQYQQSLKSLQANFKHQGFRPGSVPLEIIENEISKSKILEEIASDLISQIYSQKVKEYDLKPIIQPQIKIINPPLSLDKDWEIEITACELPKIEIKPEYQSDIKKINSQKSKDQLENIFDILVKYSSVTLPSILVSADINAKLATLIDQAGQAGLTVTEYLKSKNLTIDQYRLQLKTQIQREWQINLAIDQIAKDQHLSPSEPEIKTFTEKSPQLADNPGLTTYLLTQQKVVDYLKNLGL